MRNYYSQMNITHKHPPHTHTFRGSWRIKGTAKNSDSRRLTYVRFISLTCELETQTHSFYRSMEICTQSKEIVRNLWLLQLFNSKPPPQNRQCWKLSLDTRTSVIDATVALQFCAEILGVRNSYESVRPTENYILMPKHYTSFGSELWA